MRDCAAHSGAHCFIYADPPFRLAFARLQGGLNNFAPFGASTMAERQAQTRHPALWPGVFVFVVQGRRETKARQGFRAAGLHKAQEDAIGKDPQARAPALHGPVQADCSSLPPALGLGEG
jgi:hypothetical protein